MSYGLNCCFFLLQSFFCRKELLVTNLNLSYLTSILIEFLPILIFDANCPPTSDVFPVQFSFEIPLFQLSGIFHLNQHQIKF